MRLRGARESSSLAARLSRHLFWEHVSWHGMDRAMPSICIVCGRGSLCPNALSRSAEQGRQPDRACSGGGQPAALPNYHRRGFRTFKTEEGERT
jgi:hypothetical protein